MYNIKSFSKPVKIVCLIFGILLTFGAILFFLPISNTAVASADEYTPAWTFQSSKIVIPVSGFIDERDKRNSLFSNMSNVNYPKLFHLTFSFNIQPSSSPDVNTVNLNPFNSYISYPVGGSIYIPEAPYEMSFASLIWASVDGISFPNSSDIGWKNYNTTTFGLAPSVDSLYSNLFLLQFKCNRFGDPASVYPDYSIYVISKFRYDAGFDFSNIRYVDFGYESGSLGSFPKITGYHVLRYVSMGGLVFECKFGVVNNLITEKFILPMRTYAFSDTPDKTYDDGYSLGYNQGYNDGVSAEKAPSYNIGYADGKRQGEKSGYDKGYTAGVESANKYSFTGLIGAVIDAPIKAFEGMLDFDVFGYNMKSFYLSLITLSVIIFIVKLLI